MTKGELIDLIILNVSGGNFSPDINITRQDVAARLKGSIAAAIALEQETTKDSSYKKSRYAYPDFDIRISPEFFLTYTVEPLYDDVKCLYYINPPKKIAKTGNSIDSVYPVAGNVEFIKIRDSFEVQSMPLLDVTFWYYEESDEERVYLINLPLPVGTLSIKMMVDVDDLDDDETLPIPTSKIPLVIDELVKYFRMQVIDHPEDEIADNVEDDFKYA